VTAVLDELIAFGQAAAHEGLLISTCGNASLRVDEECIAVSASGSELRDLSAGEIAVFRLADGAHVSGPKPSMETSLHRKVYLARPGVGAVLHCQSRAATLLACHPNPPTDLNFIPEIPAYVRAHAEVPYRSPGSPDLADLVGAAFEDPEVTVVQMRNHGQTVAGATWQKAIRRAVFFELACWMAIQGHDLETIPPDDVRLLRGYSRDV